MLAAATAILIGAVVVPGPPPTAVRFAVDAPPDVPEDVRTSIEQAADAALSAAGYDVFGATGACADVSCVKTTLGEQAAAVGLQVQITAEEADYRVAVTYTAASGEVLQQRERVCEMCRYDEVVDRAVALVGDPPPAEPPEPEPEPVSPVSIVSDPVGASVYVDGRLAGSTPYSAELPQGAYTVRVEKEGYETSERNVSATGSPVRASFELTEIRVISPRAEIAIGWTALGVGLAAVATGAALLAIDERQIKSDCSGANVDVDGVCKYRYNTLAGGIVFVTVGAVATGTGIALIVHGKKSVPNDASAAFGPGGIRVRF